MRAFGQDEPASPRRYRGPQGLGEQAARVLEQGARPGEGLGAVEEQACLKRWFEEAGLLIDDQVWRSHAAITSHTAEHEVRYRQRDHRAVKRTWPGTFGFVPRQIGGRWQPQPATPGDYLARQALQNELFGDRIELEGAMIDSGPSMLIGQPSGGLSLVISQPWLDALDEHQPHPTEAAIAALLRDRGFFPLHASLFGWENRGGGWVILDAKPDNFIRTADGILPIDLLLTEFPPSSSSSSLPSLITDH